MTSQTTSKATSCRTRAAWSAALGVILALAASTVVAQHIPTGTDIDKHRTRMPNEGYLNFDHSPGPSGGGEERTGWTDIRHPAQATLAGKPGATNNVDGYDRSDHFIGARTTILTDAARATAPAGGIPNDFDYANRIWAQAGLSLIETSTRAVASPAAGAGSFSFPLSNFQGGETTIMANHNGAPGTVEVYYTGGLVSGALAETYRPSHFMGVAGEPFTDAGADGIPGSGDPGEGDGLYNPGEPFSDFGFDGVAASGDLGEGDGQMSLNGAGQNEGIFMANTGVHANPRNNTLGHELGHFLLDDGNTNTGNGNAVHLPNAGDAGHSSDQRNVVGNPQWDPGSRKDESGVNNPRWNIADNLDVLGTVMSTNADGSPKVGGTNIVEVTQIQTVYSEPDVSPWLNLPNDNSLTYGDRGDFDWVEDNRRLEAAGGRADNHPVADYLLWEINPLSVGVSTHPGHQHDGWGDLVLNPFALPVFRTVDIISQIGRYIDSDVDRRDNRSRRESALDFRGFLDTALFPEFSLDGNNWLEGTLINIFRLGWTPASRAEDFVSRWRSPIDATLIRLRAFDTGFGHDRNVQIDAVIATNAFISRIPEPSAGFLMGIALMVLCGLHPPFLGRGLHVYRCGV